ncbi:hypothetical protein C3432_06065 [Citrobacter amalonaticus]|uniref:DUF4123 domain-containing protein n=1 Tax=Citrobacter amalonaticus TaxID=35703 RepID=A0A2S4RYZ2_CITAM|nr:hypothetical protein [Citrobacter amalonaticus]POT57525.1 hypothetical protein C3432_06065 [Citrobacter amalonaticus]POT76948.1 hypothetical protein C3436_05755 [Citrobacter amalonaticus]POU66026.1 hypothetical protein C3430_12170 [Citrobacter amalonaticus]POV06183.1 hypothetical protein C3424_13055 [Citrobacter amalonaticus]
MDILRYLHHPYALTKHTHVIIDRIYYPSPPEEWKARPIVSAILSPQEKLYPWLVTLNKLNTEGISQLSSLINETTQQPFVMAISSQYPDDALILRLADAFIFYEPEVGERYLLRYYDCLVYFQLLRILTPLQLQNLNRMAGIDYCTWFDNSGGLTFDCEKIVFSGWGGYSEESVYRLRNIGLINQVLQQYEALISVESKISLSNEIERYINVARKKFGLTHHDDIKIFALSGLELHPLFWQSARVAKILYKTSSTPGAFSDEITLLDDSERRLIVTECQSKNKEN